MAACFRTVLWLMLSLQPKLSFPQQESAPLIPQGTRLLGMQQSVHPCYLQYEQPSTQLLAFNPSIFEAGSQNCICEHWWGPEKNPTQLMFYKTATTVDWKSRETDACLSDASANVVPCESFTENCIAKLWIAKGDDSLHQHALLKCTKDSSATAQPLHAVWVQEITNFDIGERCNRDAIKDMLNYRLEIYRRGSQFFKQIPVFYHDSDLIELCDPRIENSGASITVHFRCLQDVSITMPDDSKHIKPHSRDDGAKSFPPQEENICYQLAGIPWSSLLLVTPDPPEGPTPGNPLCVCEQDAVLTPFTDKCDPRSELTTVTAERVDNKWRHVFKLSTTANANKVSIRCDANRFSPASVPRVKFVGIGVYFVGQQFTYLQDFQQALECSNNVTNAGRIISLKHDFDPMSRRTQIKLHVTANRCTTNSVFRFRNLSL